MAGKRDKKGPHGGVVIKKEEIVEGGHHGGAWKVAYADFVTAMMAFFLLMWLLNATTEDQRKGLADYFSPNNLMSHASSGTGQPFGGHTAFDQGALASDRGAVEITVGKRPVIDHVEDGDDLVYAESHRARSGEGDGVGAIVEDQDSDDLPDPKDHGQPTMTSAPGPGGTRALLRDGHPDRQSPNGKDADGQSPDGQSPDGQSPDGQSRDGHGDALAGARMPTRAEIAAEKDREEKASFEQAAQQIRDAVRSDPALAELSKQLAIDMTPAGLRIQILDEIKLPMFPSGSSAPNDRARLLMQKIVPVLMKLNQSLSIAGHTDAAPFPGPGRSNWELSAERANATRRLLVDGGLAESRIRSVSGHADRDPLLPADPLAAANRRIAILVLRDAITAPSAAQPVVSEPVPEPAPQPAEQPAARH